MVDVRSSPTLRTIPFLIAIPRLLGTADERGSTPMTEDAVFTQRRRDRQEGRRNETKRLFGNHYLSALGVLGENKIISVYLRSSAVSDIIAV